MKISYQKKTFRPEVLRVINRANSILEEYAAQGFDLTLRQLYYQFVARGVIANKDTEYKRLGSIVNDARLAGLIDWDHITDRTRNMRQNSHWDSPQSIVEACAKQFQLDKWSDQENYVEVWMEKDALVGVLEVVCRPLDVPYFSCRGYTSQSEMWGASQRLLGKIRQGKKVHIIHLGDHDPSGIDMSRDINDRILMFLEHHLLRDHVRKSPGNGIGDEESMEVWQKRTKYEQASWWFSLNRIALNMNQVREYNPPPNPAKLTDSRATSYVEEYGDESWELDALEPAVITGLITAAVEGLRDENKWERARYEESGHQADLALCAEQWDRALEYIRPGGEKAEEEES